MCTISAKMGVIYWNKKEQLLFSYCLIDLPFLMTMPKICVASNVRLS